MLFAKGSSMYRNTQMRYDRLSQLFHWLTAVLALTAFVLGPGDFGRVVDQGVDPASRIDIVLHETAGVLVFLLTLLRVIWMRVRPPVSKTVMSESMRVASQVVHVALLVLLCALPVTAILMLGTESQNLTLLGGVHVGLRLPTPLVAVAHSIDWGGVHALLGDGLMILAGLHAAAGLFHHVILRDGVLRSMYSSGREFPRGSSD
jgi:cytochrome b561